MVLLYIDYNCMIVPFDWKMIIFCLCFEVR